VCVRIHIYIYMCVCVCMYAYMTSSLYVFYFRWRCSLMILHTTTSTTATSVPRRSRCGRYACRGHHLRPTGSRTPDSRCFVEDKRPLCQLSSKRLKEKWHNWYSTARFLCNAYPPRTPPPPSDSGHDPPRHTATTLRSHHTTMRSDIGRSSSQRQ